MKGQWIGRSTSGQDGFIVLNIDDLGAKYEGVTYFLPDDKKYALSACFFTIYDKNTDFRFSAAINPVNRANGIISTWEEIKLLNPEIPHSTTVEVSGHYEDNSILLKARTNLDVVIEGHVARQPASEYSVIVGESKTWEEYKIDVASLSNRNMLYRGQEQNWKLRTAFHRRGRYNISRFIGQDIPRLHQRLSARTKHVFNLGISVENGAFFNLAQHHGYPTPLLDWTFSPYVAAFFAFRNIPKTNTADDKRVRIYIFDQEKWKADNYQLLNLDSAWLHVSIMEFLAIDNERLIPQQAATTISNIDDIEGYITSQEKSNGYRYLRAIDIPCGERNKVVSELSYMGITAGSMFPGLDGACEELREKLFDE